MQKTIFTLLGFILFLFGFLSLVLSLVGVQFAFLAWLDKPSPLFGFIARIVMILAGVIMVSLAQTDWERERRESEA